MENDFYTYAYFREDGTPYYIGKGRGNRAYHKKKKEIKVPPRERVVILKKGLTEEEAYKHEVYLIFVLGRKNTGTGILRNLTDGGEGTSGKKLTPEHIAKRQKTRGSYPTGEAHHNYGRKQTPEARAKIKEARARQTNVSGGCAHPWWVNEEGEKTRALECPGEGWQRGMKWDPRGGRDGKNRRWVNKDGEQRRSPIWPGEGWQNGTKWKD